MKLPSIHAEQQAVTIERNEEVLKAKLHAVEVNHQERLESLTNKCLAFEEKLSEWCRGTGQGCRQKKNQGCYLVHYNKKINFLATLSAFYSLGA